MIGQRHLAAIALILGIVLASPPPAYARDYLVEGKQLLQKGDLRAAQIALRNAVRDDARSGEARFRLATIHLALGDPTAAEKEARVARELGYDPPATIALLAQTYLATGRFRQLLEELKPDGKDPVADAELLTAYAQAQGGLRNGDAARSLLTEAQKMAPNSVPGLLAASQLAFIANDRDDGERRLDSALALNPNSVAALSRKAQILRSKNDNAGAITIYDRLIAQSPEMPVVRIDRAQALIAIGQDDKARLDVAAVLNVLPASVQALYTRAVLEARAKDYKAADATLQRLNNVLPNMPRGLYLQAIVKQNVGQLEQAVDAAQKHVGRYPGDIEGAKLLARLQIQNRRPDLAAAALTRLAEANVADADLYDLLGRAHGASGQADKAVQAFQRAANLAPDNAALRTRLANARLGSGNPEGAAGDLERSLELAPTAVGVGEALFFTELATGDLEKAAAAIERIRKAQGDTPPVANMEGVLKIAQRDYEGARAAFNKAISLQADFMPAKANLARLAVIQNRFPEAEEILAGLLAKQADSEPALGMYVGLVTRRNDLARAIEVTSKAIAANPGNTRARLILAELHMRNNKDSKQALEALSLPGGAEMPIDLLTARARVQAAAGENADARDSFAKVLAINPRAVDVRRQLVGLLAAAGETERARSTLEAGMRLDPKNYQLMEDFAALDLRAGGLDMALATADRLQRQAPQDFPMARALRGDVYVAAKRFDEALKAYEDAQKTAPSSALTLRLAAILNGTGKPDDAFKLLRDWLKANPDDIAVAQMLSGMEIGSKQFNEAEISLNSILTRNPRDGVALNNLAWVYQVRGDRRARPIAEKAYLLMPGPQTADTLGWILVSEGAIDSAVVLLRQAATDLPGDPRIQYHYAVALNRAGQKDEAIKLLKPVAEHAATFDEKIEAQKLLEQLK